MVQALQIYCKIILNRWSSCQKLIKYVPFVGGGWTTTLYVCACVCVGGPSVSLGGSVWLHLEGPCQQVWCPHLWPPAPGWNLWLGSYLKRYHCSHVGVHRTPQRFPATLQTLPQAAWWGYCWGRSKQIIYIQILKAKACTYEVGQGQSRK